MGCVPIPRLGRSIEMVLDNVARGIERWTRPLSVWMSSLGAICLMVMMFWVVADVIMRGLFNRPIIGSYEIVEYMMVAFVFMSFAHAQFCRVHICVPVVVEKLSPRTRAAVDAFTGIVTLGMAAIMVWGSLRQTQAIWAANQTSAVLFIPKWPFELLTGFGLLIFWVAKLEDVMRNLYRAGGGGSVPPEATAEELRTI